MTEQPALFDAKPRSASLTVADIDEWIATLNPQQYKGQPLCSCHPHEWARAALADVLGEDVPDRLWSGRELTTLLQRAKEMASQ